MAEIEEVSVINDVRFNLTTVHDAFAKCVLGEDDVELDNYLIAFNELLKFFQLMGSVFGFVASDVQSKIEILEEFRKGEDKENFVSVKGMMQYEIDNSLLNKSGYVSGSRTLLRLHRGLEFIRLFLERIGALQDDEKTVGVCQESYKETLSKYHPWIIRKGAHLAMFTLPTKNGMLEKVCGNAEEAGRALALLPKMLEISGDVYQRTDQAYTTFQLHDLP